MIDPREFEAAGFTEAQVAALVRAFERYEQANTQRFVQQAALDDAVRRIDQRFDRLEQAIGRMADLLAEFMRQTERSFAQLDERLGAIEQRLDRIEEHLRRPGPDGNPPDA